MAGDQGEQNPPAVRAGRNSELKNSFNRIFVGYLIAIAAPVLALVWRLGMIRSLGHDLPTYITFYPAVMVAAIVAGLGAGLIATATSALLAMYWVFPPHGFAIANRADAVGLVLFASMGVFVSVVAEHYGRVRQKAAEYKQELAQLENERQFRVLADAMPQLALMANSDGWIFWYNQRWYQYTGTTPEQMEGWGWQSVHDPATLPVVLERWNASIATGESFDMVFPLRGAGGEFHPFLTRVMPVKDSEGKVVRWFGTNTDISEQKRTEAQLQRLNRTLTALNNSNQAMLKATDEAELLEKVCGIITGDCGHAMVWIGFAENDEGKTVRPVAHAGFEEGYLETLGITWADTERGRGPTGTAIRTGQASVCRNMFTDPKFKPWRAEALKRGYASSAVVPLMAEGKGFGAITIYSREPETFSEGEIRLLMELAGDLSHGINAIRMRKAHADAVEELRRVSEQRRLALEAAKLGAWDYRFDTGEVFWDERCRDMWGIWTGDQVDYSDAIARIHVDDRAATDEAVKQAIAGADDGVYHREFRVVWPDGSVHWISSTGRVYFDGEGDERRAVRFIGVNIDTTERMQAEEKLHEHREWLRVTLTSIGDAVMTSDAQGRVTFLNPVAEALTGWKTEEALGQPIQSVFRIINEQTGEPAADIVGEVLQERRIVALANHTALLTKDGHERPIEDSAAPITDAAGEATGVVLVFHDVTDRRAAQEALRKSEERVRLKLESILSPEGDIGALELADIIDVPALQALMQEFYRLAGIPMAIVDLKGDVLVGVGWQDICTKFHRVNPESCRHCVESDLELSADVKPGEFKLYRCKNNMWDVATPITIGGKHVGNLFAGQFFFEGESPDRQIFQLQAKKYGFNEGEYLAALDRVPKLSRDELATGMAYFTKLADMISKLSFSNIKLARSLTQRDILADSLRSSEERLRITLTSIGDAVMTSDAQGCVTFLNPVAEALTGWKTEQALGQPIQNVFRIINEETGEPAADIVGQVLRERRIVALANHTALVTKDGAETPIEDSAAPITDAAGEVTGVVLVFHDVTQRRAAQEALRQNEERLRFHFENTPLAVVEWGPDFRLSKWSGEAERIFGWRAEEILGKRMDEFKWVHDDDAQKVADIAGGLLDGSCQRSVSQNRNYRKDGSIVHCEWYNSSLLDASGNLISILSLVLDITDRKQTQEALIRNEKLASVGRMAASIAHEINNPLAAVMNTLYLARNSEGTPANVRHYLDIADEELKRVSHITRQALGFYRESSVPAEVSVSAILDSAVDVLQSRIKATGARIEKQYDGDIQITAVGGELRQVFSNLLLNSIEALGENGVVRLRARRATRQGDGEHAVRITVADNGKGIEPSLRSRVFEPLFTTKDATGTGLGLWVTKEIVEKHGGTIRFRSRAKGRTTGTVFSVVIPAKPEGLKLGKARAVGSN
jgi:PAS domain S-box-containing protein